MSAVTLPSWLDAETLRTLALVLMLVLLVSALLVAKIVKALIIKGTLLLALAVVGLALWSQRQSLSDCAATCDCTFFGLEVQLPDDVRRVRGC